MFIHGGFWRARFDIEAIQSLAAVCAEQGHAVWNLEYPRVGMPGGGWPGTALAVAAGVEAALQEAQGRPVVLVGHSAGGQLALWAARERPPSLVVSLAGVTDMEAAARAGLGQGAVVGLLGGEPEDDPERYAQASPIQRLPLGTSAVLIHGDADDRVPVQQSRDYATAAAAAGDRCDLHELAGVDHFALVDAGGPAWPIVDGYLRRLEGSRPKRSI